MVSSGPVVRGATVSGQGIRSWVGPDKTIVIEHFDVRQTVPVGNEFAGNKVVQVQNIGRQSINVIG
jgi:hypothetical protein